MPFPIKGTINKPNLFMKKLLNGAKQRNTKRAFPFVLFFLLACTSLSAQTNVTGTVSDAKGTTIPGATVMITGTQKGVMTDVNGKYAISVPEDGSLSFSFIGYLTQVIPVNGRTGINVILKESTETLNEVVVIGYGTQKKNDINSSVSTIKAKDLADMPQVSFEQMMQGRAAGVTITNNSGAPGSSVSVKIRGASSLTGTNEPLYVIDGIPISGDATNKSTSGRPVVGNDFVNSGANAVSPLAMINPNDIETIDILKDASATAIYGSRGANGVVIVTTKSGKRGTGKLAYDTYVSFQEQSKLLSVMNLRQYAVLQNALADVYGQEPRVEFAHPELLGNGTNWQKEIYRSAILKNHQLSFSGGNNGTNYYLSGSYTDQDGTVIGSDFKRYTFRANVDAKLKDWLKVGVNIFTGITNENITLNGQANGIVSTSLLSAPDVAVKNLDGSYAGPPVNDASISFINPVALALSKTNQLIRKNFSGNFFAEFKLLKGLEYRFELGANTEFSENMEFLPTYQWGSASNATAVLDQRRQDYYSVNVKNLLTYRTSFGKHNITILAGEEANESRWKGTSLQARGFLSNDIHTISVSQADALLPTSDYVGSQALYSFFGRAIYDYNSKYSLTASIRADGSSKFADGNKWGYFPAVSGSWKISNESFMEGTKKYIDNIKLRVGYGSTGNQQIPNYLYGSTLVPAATGLGTGFFVNNFSNPDLKWESSNQTNIGLDFTLLDSKLNATIEVYRKNSRNFLYQVPLGDYITGGESYYGGIAAPYANIGSMRNDGIDLTLSYATPSGKDFSWNSTLTVSHYKNKVLDLNDGFDLSRSIYLNDFTPAVVTNTFEGQPIGLFYGHHAMGIFRTQAQLDAAQQNGVPTTYYGNAPQLGDVIYQDVNGDNKIDEKDLRVIGNPHPDFTYGFTNSFKYKNFDLSVFLQGSQGNDLLNLTRRAGTLNANLYTNQLAEASDFYTADNTDAKLPRPVNALSHPNNKISDRYIEDGSYLRIQNVTLAYSLPTNIISKVKITKLRFYAGVQNLYTFTKYTGYDPEVGSANQDILFSGVDNGRYPTPRTYTFGMNVEF